MAYGGSTGYGGSMVWNGTGYASQPYQANVPPTYVPPQGNYIPGKVVGSAEQIAPADVPMSGESWFPLSDGSKVVRKRWNVDGTIQTSVYSLQTEPEPDPLAEVNRRLERIERDLYSSKDGD